MATKLQKTAGVFVLSFTATVLLLKISGIEEMWGVSIGGTIWTALTVFPQLTVAVSLLLALLFVVDQITGERGNNRQPRRGL